MLKLIILLICFVLIQSTYADPDNIKLAPHELSPYSISLFEPNYILPYYYTQHPDQDVYNGSTPDDQTIQHSEFKGQISLEYPIFYHLFHHRFDLFASYTQLSYWQFYAKSQYFRETDYEPALFFKFPISHQWTDSVGVVHESNGKGGELERSWNRAYADFVYRQGPWYISLKPWLLIFQSESSDLHNPDISDYLGYGRILVAYHWKNGLEATAMVRNMVYSFLSRTGQLYTLSYPVNNRLRVYLQAFNGYGQSLIEYNHRTSSIGIGITLNDWT